jgi:hypothetical protein
MKRRTSIITFLLLFVIWICANGASTLILAQGGCTGAQVLNAKNCGGDTNSPEEQSLFQLVNKYRAANNRPELRLSSSLSMLANRRLLDLKLNVKTLTHSWSNCPYDIKDEKTWPCVIDAPRRLNTGYKGQGYETLYRTVTGRASPSLALEAWEKSNLHNSIILNLGMFKDMTWDEVGIAVDGQFAALWFGYPGTGGKGVGTSELGLGVSYDQAVTGLSKILSVNLASATVEANKWQGYSADKKIKLEIFGTRKDVSEASLAISMKIEAGKLSAKGQAVLSTFLKNLFPEWPDRDTWIASSVAAITADRTASKTKLVRKISVEMSSNGTNSLRLLITPESKPKYTEVF